jgi:hypothetical protein
LQDPLDPDKKHIWGPGLRRNREFMKGVVAFAKEIGKPAVHVALNFLRYQNVIPIFSMRTLAQATENLGCLDWQLTPEQFAKLQEITLPALSTPIVAQGYPNDFLDYGSPAIPGFNVRQMTFGFVGKDIDYGDHRPVKYPGGTVVRPEP